MQRVRYTDIEQLIVCWTSATFGREGRETIGRGDTFGRILKRLYGRLL